MSPAVRTQNEIATEIATTRNQLAATIDQLVYRAHPKTIAKRQLAATRAKFVLPNGDPDKEMIIKVAGGAVGVLATIVTLRKLLG
ncbi:MAG: DUF3618 domain-containing protein [Nocardioidaceae bacterium]